MTDTAREWSDAEVDALWMRALRVRYIGASDEDIGRAKMYRICIRAGLAAAPAAEPTREMKQAIEYANRKEAGREWSTGEIDEAIYKATVVLDASSAWRLQRERDIFAAGLAARAPQEAPAAEPVCGDNGCIDKPAPDAADHSTIPSGYVGKTAAEWKAERGGPSGTGGSAADPVAAKLRLAIKLAVQTYNNCNDLE